MGITRKSHRKSSTRLESAGDLYARENCKAFHQHYEQWPPWSIANELHLLDKTDSTDSAYGEVIIRVRHDDLVQIRGKTSTLKRRPERHEH